MELKCNWCQKTAEISDKLVPKKGDTSDYICSECLVAIMPTSGKKEEIKNHEMNMAVEGVEKRRSPRFPVFLPVRIGSQDEGQSVTSAMILDASSTGLKVESEYTLRRNDTLDLTLRGNDITFMATGKVIYTEEIEVEDVSNQKAGIKLLDEFHKVK
jgi:hypothetical protein